MFALNPRHQPDIAHLHRRTVTARAILRENAPRHGDVAMHPEDIKAAIRKAGSSQIAIARKLGVSDVAVNHVIYGRSTSRRIADEISRVTKIPLSKLWPGRYEPKN
jgi:lambda repressor-like predicted transcriptional regulator